MTSPAISAEIEGRLLSAEAEARGFHRIERRVLRTVLRQTLAVARLRLTLLVALSALLWAGLFAVVREGFGFLRTTISQPSYEQVVHGLFSMFFLCLFCMLLFSSSLILYGALFRSREVAMLLTLPVRVERIFLHKFQEAVWLSGWGFLLLGSPMLLAYGVVAQAPWYYYAMLAPLMAAFVYIPVALGAILCLAVMYWAPTRRALLLVLAAAALAGAMIWFFGGLLLRPESDLLTTRWFREMLGRLQMTEWRLAPHWWLSEGLAETGDGAWSEGILFLALLVANALFVREVSVWIAGRMYRRGLSRMGNAGGGSRRRWLAWFDAAIRRALPGVPHPVRLMFLKDLRLFRRDPVQWSQFLILFALLGLYSLNVRPFQIMASSVRWVSMVSFMNLCVVGLLMATFTTRFIFPLISLEGCRLWLLGLLPLRRDTIVWSKFLFSLGSLWAPSAALVFLSDWRLGVSALIRANHQLTCGILVLGLSGIAVGLGARLPNLRESSPARIAAGFGGTLNLVLATIYIMAVVGLLALPCHFQGVAESTRLDAFQPMQAWLRLWLVGGALGSLLLGAAATAVPLWIGLRAFRRLEY